MSQTNTQTRLSDLLSQAEIYHPEAWIQDRTINPSPNRWSVQFVVIAGALNLLIPPVLHWAASWVVGSELFMPLPKLASGLIALCQLTYPYLFFMNLLCLLLGGAVWWRGQAGFNTLSQWLVVAAVVIVGGWSIYSSLLILCVAVATSLIVALWIFVAVVCICLVILFYAAMIGLAWALLRAWMG